MQVKELLTDDDAVSPVIGVILMVAITVILAAVIAAFVLGLGDTSDPGPQVSFDYDYDSGAGELEITVSSGDRFEAERISFRGQDFDGSTWNEVSDGSFASSSIVRAGDSVTLGAGSTTGTDSGNGVTDDFELDIVFTSEDGQDSSVIATRTGPDA